MTLQAGIVVVNPNGTEQKTPGSMSALIYDNFINGYKNDTGETLPAGPVGAAIKKGYATIANHVSAGVIDHITGNAEVTGVRSTGSTVFSQSTVLCSAGGANVSGGFGGNTSASPGISGPWAQPAGNFGTIS